MSPAQCAYSATILCFCGGGVAKPVEADGVHAAGQDVQGKNNFPSRALCRMVEHADCSPYRVFPISFFLR